MTRQIVTEIVGDAKKFSKATDDASASAGRMGGSFSKMGSVVKTAGLAIAGAVVVAAAAFVAFGLKSIDNAVGQERAWNRVKTVFGKGSDQVVKWAETNSRAFGVTDDALELSVANYAKWAKNSGMSSAEATAAAEAVAKRAAEISLATGQSYDEVFAKLQKGSQGAVKGVKEYGVVINTSSLENFAWANGIAQQGEKLTENEKALARQGLILQQTAGFTKDAAAMSGGYADQQRKLGVIVDEVQDAIGAAFLNVATAVMPTVTAAFDWISTNVVPAMGLAFDWIGANVLPKLSAAFDWIGANVLPPLGTAFDWIGANVVPALGAAFDWISATVLPAISGAFDWISTNILPKLQVAFGFISTEILPALGSAFDWIKTNVLPPLGAAFSWITTNVVPPLTKAFGWVIENILPALGGAIDWIVKNVLPPLKVGLGIAGDVFRTVFNTISSVVRTSIDTVTGIINGVKDVIGGIGDVIRGVSDTVGSSVGDIVGFFTGLPGKIGRAVGGMFDGIWGAFKSALNSVIRAWNSIKFTLPSVDLGPFGVFGGFTLGTPNLPYFHAGGIVPGPTGANVPIMAQAGERILPLGSRGASGGTGGGGDVHVHVHGNVYGISGVDELADLVAGRLRLQGATAG